MRKKWNRKENKRRKIKEKHTILKGELIKLELLYCYEIFIEIFYGKGKRELL